MLTSTKESLNTEKLPSIVTHSHATEMVNDTEDQSIDLTPKGQTQTSSSAMGAIHEDNKAFLSVAAIGVGTNTIVSVVAAAQPNCNHGNQCNG